MKPTAAPPIFPYPHHRTMAEVIRDERPLTTSQRKRVGNICTFNRKNQGETV